MFNGSVFHLDWHPAEEKQAKDERRHYPKRYVGEGTRECMTWGVREAARAAVAEKGVRF